MVYCTSFPLLFFVHAHILPSFSFCCFPHTYELVQLLLASYEVSMHREGLLSIVPSPAFCTRVPQIKEAESLGDHGTVLKAPSSLDAMVTIVCTGG